MLRVLVAEIHSLGGLRVRALTENVHGVYVSEASVGRVQLPVHDRMSRAQ